MDQPLEGLRLKLKCADEHLARLDAEVSAVAQYGYRIIGELESQSGEYVFRADSKEPPLRWGVEISILAHLWRTSLDNLFWHRILAARNTPHDKAEFPIFKDEPAFDHRKAQPRSQGLATHDWAFIEEAQPFKAGDHWNLRDPLWLLHELNRLDKHRFVHVGFMAMAVDVPDMNGVSRPVPMVVAGELIKAHLSRHVGQRVRIAGTSIPWPVRDCTPGGFRWTSGDSDDRTEIARVVCNVTGPNPQMQMQPAPTLDISFGDPQVPVTLVDLRRIGARVNEVVGWLS